MPMPCKRLLLPIAVVLMGAGLCCLPPRTVSGQKPDSPKPQKRSDRPANPLQQLSPRLQTVLKNWEQSSKKIDSLEGKHFRHVYNTVFNVEKQAQGYFYYEAPDKGRIDIKKVTIPEKSQSQKEDPKTGKPYKLQSDHPERWVCDGKKIWKINDEEETAEVFPIPPERQGQNIMQGPLPFLFGLPAEEAARRFTLELLRETDQHVWLKASPRWQQDRANYKQAYVILDKESYLPNAVKLIGPAGNLETVYKFGDLKVNKPEPLIPIFRQDPFKPDLDGYKVTRNTPPKRVPSLIGLNYTKAKEILIKTGIEEKRIKFVRGKPAPNSEMVYHVSAQNPEPRSKLPDGKPVVLTLYVKSDEQQSR